MWQLQVYTMGKQYSPGERVEDSEDGRGGGGCETHLVARKSAASGEGTALTH